jgi:hypothetical protein
MTIPAKPERMDSSGKKVFIRKVKWSLFHNGLFVNASSKCRDK